MTEREFATEVVSKLQREGYQALFAGGCVRDELLGLEPADYDVATSATPDDVKKLFRRCHSFGASFGVVEVLGPKDATGEWLKVQVATFRSDGTYTDGRRPDSVAFSSPEEDAARRDFTINGLFFDPVAKRVDDFVGGEADLRAKVLRAIGDPHQRFAEDKLRILRAVRMAARFELTVDPATLAAAREMAPQIQAVSAERIAEELRKMLTNRHRARAVELLHTVGLFGQILPEVSAPLTPDGIRSRSSAVAAFDPEGVVLSAQGERAERATPWVQDPSSSDPEGVVHDRMNDPFRVDENNGADPGRRSPSARSPWAGGTSLSGSQTGNAAQHSSESGVGGEGAASFELAFAALLRGVDAKTATKIGKRLRLSNDELDRVVWLVAHRDALVNAATLPNSTLYPILIHPGIGELIALHRADGNVAGAEHVEHILRDTPTEVLNPPPLLTGDDLKAMGLKPGPPFKKLLDTVRTLQLDGQLATRADAEEKVRELIRTPG